MIRSSGSTKKEKPENGITETSREKKMIVASTPNGKAIWRFDSWSSAIPFVEDIQERVVDWKHYDLSSYHWRQFVYWWYLITLRKYKP